MYKEDLALNNLQWLICHKTKPNQKNPIYLIYMYKEDLALNNLQWLICHKTKPNQKNPIYLIYMYKEDLALNNLQWLICHKTKPNLVQVLNHLSSIQKSRKLTLCKTSLFKIWHIVKLLNRSNCNSLWDHFCFDFYVIHHIKSTDLS